MKRFAILSLTLLLLATVLIVPAVFADTQGTVSASNANVAPGEEFEIVLSMSNNPGLISLLLEVSYNTDAFELKSVTDGGILGTPMHANYLKKHPYTLSWSDDLAMANMTSNGTLVTLRFLCKEGASVGTSEQITVKAPNQTMTAIGIDENFDFVEVNLKYVNGTVNIISKPVSVSSVSLDKSSISLGVGETASLVATVSPDNATNKSVSWKSSNTSVVTVDQNGKIKGVREGSATITVTTADGSKTASAVVTVSCKHTHTENVAAVESTCTKAGHGAYTKCTDCGKVISGSAAALPLAEHKTSLQGKKDATCSEAGYTGDQVCSVCNKVVAKGKSVAKLEHKDADNNGVCDICNTVLSADESKEPSEDTSDDVSEDTSEDVSDEVSTGESEPADDKSEDISTDTSVDVSEEASEESKPESNSNATASGENESESGMPNVVIYIIIAVVLLICGAIVFFVIRKKK